MAVDTWKRRTLCAATIARAFLAVNLLLSAFDSVFQFTFRAQLAFSLELLLGAAIAVGWLMRYAAALVLLGTLAASFLVPQFHIASLPANAWTTTFVLIASGILVCFGRNTDNVDASPINEDNKLSNADSRSFAREPWDEDVEVTIRLEDGYVRSLRRRRCIVTIHDRGDGVRKAGQEAWYARDDR
ncbi:MAG: hypothetical protein ABSA54_00825 [Terriglobales bacterium]|jgi:hypothetical protein